MSEREQLEGQLDTLRRSLHALALAKQAATTTGQLEAARQLGTQIQQTAQVYNTIVARLREIEGPGSVLPVLDKVGDVVIDGAKVGARVVITAGGQVVQATGDVAAGVGGVARGLGVTAKLFPVLVLAVLAVVGIGLYRGSLQARATVAR